MTEPVESDTVYYIKTDAPINKDSVKEDDGTYLTPQNKIAPSSQDETGSKNKTGDEKENEDVQSDRIIIKLKCAVVVLMTIVLFALMALAVHLATSHPHSRKQIHFAFPIYFSIVLSKNYIKISLIIISIVYSVQ